MRLTSCQASVKKHSKIDRIPRVITRTDELQLSLFLANNVYIGFHFEATRTLHRFFTVAFIARACYELYMRVSSCNVVH